MTQELVSRSGDARSPKRDRETTLPDYDRQLRSFHHTAENRPAAPYLEPTLFKKLTDLIDPNSKNHILQNPYLQMTWLNVLAIGKKR